jgi:hypothetical protein
MLLSTEENVRITLNYRLLSVFISILICAAVPVSAQTYLFYGTPGDAVKAQMMLDLKATLQDVVALRSSIQQTNQALVGFQGVSPGLQLELR